MTHATHRAAPSRAPAALFAAATAALAVEFATHLVDFGVYDLSVRMLDSGYEWSYSHVLATLAFGAGAVVGLAGGVAAPSRRVAWLSAGGLFAFLFADNVTRLHEHVRDWPLFYAPALLALFVAVVLAADGSELTTVVAVGLALLLGSLVIHVVGPSVVRAFGWAPDGWAYQVKVALKEGMELAGWVLVVPALATLAVRRWR